VVYFRLVLSGSASLNSALVTSQELTKLKITFEDSLIEGYNDLLSLKGTSSNTKVIEVQET
jgi:hypothetical protein